MTTPFVASPDYFQVNAREFEVLSKKDVEHWVVKPS
jgi:hypothetical protein